MNEKLAKAKRRALKNKASVLDIERLKRNTFRGARLAGVISKAPKQRKKKPFRSMAPSWPRGENQRAQSRPMIVIRPLAHLGQDKSEERKQELRELLSRTPKFILDRMVLLKLDL